MFLFWCALYAFWDLSPPLLLAFVQAAEPWWYCAFGFTWCVFSFGLSPTGSARLLSFTRPNRGDRVSFGFVHRVPPLLPPPIPSASIHSGCRIAVILRFQLRLCPIDTHQEIGDMVILRFRVSLCCTLGSILICIFGFYFGPPTTGSIGLRLHRAAELW